MLLYKQIIPIGATTPEVDVDLTTSVAPFSQVS